MKKFCVIFFLIVRSLNVVYGQDYDKPIKELDSLYREDQFYIGASYNFFGNKPSDLEQNGFSLGFHFGFIKDMPINTRRNIAIGLGLGYSTNSFNSNLFIEPDDELGYAYSIISDNLASISTKKFSQHLIEVPVEFRWRTSNASDYNFWRIYAGLKLGYLVRNSVKYVGDTLDVKHINIDDFNSFQYGLNINVGYNTWNVNLYYGLNPIFSKDIKINDELIEMKTIKIGLMFYIL